MKKELDRLESTKNAVSGGVPYEVAQRYTVPHHMVTTTFVLEGFRVVRTLGVVRGITVRSRSLFGTIGAGLQTLVGGNITILTNLCEQARTEAFEIMVLHAAEIGANAVIGMRYDATEIMQGVTEVLAYGTAVVVEPIRDEQTGGSLFGGNAP
ncbi:MAG: YbjQ family protein [Blastocatellia bacterium]|nr:YbjQ family protein [Blastocatellia bacterium]